MELNVNGLGAVFFSGGILVRILSLLYPNIQKSHFILIAFAIFVGIGAFFIQEKNFQHGFFASCFFSIFVVALFLKDEIIPKISEGLLLLYSLVFLYLVETQVHIPGWLEAVIILYVLFVLGIALSKVRLNFFLEAFSMISFIGINIFLATIFLTKESLLLFCAECGDPGLVAWELFFMGMFFFTIVSNGLYIVQFLVGILPEKWTLKIDKEKVKESTAILWEKYIDKDVSFITIFVVFCIAAILPLNFIYGFMHEILAVSIVLLIGQSYLSSEKMKSLLRKVS